MRTEAQIAMEDAGLTVDDIARRFRRSPETVRGWLRGGDRLHDSHIPKLARMLGLPQEWFLYAWKADPARQQRTAGKGKRKRAPKAR